MDDRTRALSGRGFSPDTLPGQMYAVDEDSQTLETRINKVLRPPSERQAKQVGSPYRSDLMPSNYSVHQFYMPDEDLAVNPNNYPEAPSTGVWHLYEVPCDFPVWAIVAYKAYGRNGGPNNVLAIPDIRLPNIDPTGGGLWFNLPVALTNPRIALTGSAPVSDGAGWQLWFYDRWIPQPSGLVAFQ